MPKEIQKRGRKHEQDEFICVLFLMIIAGFVVEMVTKR